VNARRNTPAYQDFTATVDDPGAGPRLTLSSGTPGAGTSVQVLAAGADPLASTLGLLSDTTATGGVNTTL
jgi:hypothetical protein